MHTSSLAVIVGAAFSLIVAPAKAAWNSYVSYEVDFSFIAPGNVTTEGGSWRGLGVGAQESTVFTSTEDNIKYEVTVTNFAQAKAESATILGAVTFAYQDRQRVLMDTYSRVESGDKAVYGRKITIDIPNDGGRSTAGFYFHNGYLIQIEATVLPANGDYQSPYPGRFVRSIAFDPARVGEDAIDLMLLE